MSGTCSPFTPQNHIIFLKNWCVRYELNVFLLGFNQTLYPAHAAAQALGVPLIAEGVFAKAGRPPQSRLRTHAARRRNIRGAFAVRGELPPRLLLVDDVVTSGATLHEAARILAAAGVQEITALAVAAAHRPHP